MTLNDVTTLILRYFTEFSSFRAHLVKVVDNIVVRKFTFAISRPDEFLVYIYLSMSMHVGYICLP